MSRHGIANASLSCQMLEPLFDLPSRDARLETFTWSDESLNSGIT